MRKSHVKSCLALVLSVLLALGALSACTLSLESGGDTAADTADLAAAKNAGSDDLTDLTIDTRIQLKDGDTTVNGSGAVFENGVLTITKGGTYELKGSLSDGQIIVDTGEDAKVKLLFGGVTLHSSTSAPLYVVSSPKETKLLLAEGSENTLSDSADRTAQGEEDPDAVIFSKDDLEISGTGTLNIEANVARGIVSKDALQISGGTLNVTAADDALRGKDGVDISGGVLNLKSGGDGIQAADEDKGDLTVSGGVLTLNADKDGLQAEGTLTVTGGVLDITCGGDALKGAADVTVTGGSMNIDAGSDGLHADENLTLTGGSVNIKQAKEGLEGTTVTLSGAAVEINATDDGINAAAPGSATDDAFTPPEFPDGDFTPPAGENGAPPARPDGDFTPPAGENGAPPVRPDGDFTPPAGENGGPRGGFPGGKGGFGYDAASHITITGGSVTVNAEGDGLDSNGDIKMTGGSVTVFGPENNGNSALDYGGSFEMTGGTLLAVGSSGMAQSISTGCAAIAVNCEIAAGEKVELRAENGKTLTGFTAPKKIGHVVYADGSVKAGESYRIIVNGNTAANAAAK